MSKKLIVKQRVLVGQPRDWPRYVPETIQRIFAARGVLDPSGAERRLTRMHSPNSLGGIQDAARLIGTAILGQKRIVVAGDYDCDGATGAAVAVRGLRLLGAQHVDFVIPNRFRHGYGLSVDLVDSIDPVPDMIITVDSGVSNVEGVAHAKAKGITVVITDHHLPGDTLPDADAIVNPNLKDDQFPSKALAGVGVMLYTLIAVQRWLDQQAGYLLKDKVNLTALLDLVAVGTVADLVPLDFNNRVLVESGLTRIREGRACVGLRALIRIAEREERALTATNIAFSIAPLLNAAGRLEDMRLGVLALLTDDLAEAEGYVQQLKAINAQRKDIQAKMTVEAEEKIATLNKTDHHGVVLFDPSWHSGIVGLVASRMKESLHRPAIALAPAEPGSHEIRGSARSIPGFHLRDALALLDARHPKMMKKFGGHAMAAGLSLDVSQIEPFKVAFDEIAKELLTDEMLESVIYTDGPLEKGELTLDFARELRRLGPWGQAFPEPVFENVFYVQECTTTSPESKHVRMTLVDIRDGSFHAAIFFNGVHHQHLDEYVKVVFELNINVWNSRESVQLMVRQETPVPNPLKREH